MVQPEIMAELGITDVDFNLYFSVKGMVGMVSQIIATFFLKQIGVKKLLFFVGIGGVIGQAMTWYGLQISSHEMVLAGRSVLGVTEVNHLLYKIVLMDTLTEAQLPFALSSVITAMKLVSLLHDNIAAPIYNHFGMSLLFLAGLVVSVFSFMCAVSLIRKIETPKEKPENKELSTWQALKAMPGKFYYLVLADSLILIAIKTFYPNMSKFYQETYGFSNTEAGTLASVPNLVGSLLCTPIGALFSISQSLNGWLLSYVLVLGSHASYLLIPTNTEQSQMMSLAPLLMFSVGHAGVSTLRYPSVMYSINNKAFVPMVLSTLSIVSGTIIPGSLDVSTYLYEEYKDYTVVTVYMTIAASIGILTLSSLRSLVNTERAKLKSQ